MDESKIAPSAYELGKHMSKLTVDDQPTSLILLRPRYAKSSHEMEKTLKSIARWQKSSDCKINILLVPSDYDVFAFERRPSWKKEQPEDALASALKPVTPSLSETISELP